MFSCSDTAKSTQKETASTNTETKRISQREIEAISYTDFGLSKESREAISNWLKYQELRDQIRFLKKGDLSFFKGERALIDAFLNDFKNETPSTLNTNAITARMIVLETKLLKLNSTLLLDNIAKEEQLQGIKEFLIAASNLNLQINKKFELEANNIGTSF